MATVNEQTADIGKQTYTESFQTEVTELLQLIIHSLYSHPKIFLRELISNASDAIDKVQLESLTAADLLPANFQPEIRLETGKNPRVLKIKDNGIGMTEDELRENIGTIARSGTREFVRMKKELQENPNLIGQFGVGFYSAFMVADRVAVETQKAGTDSGARWESDGKGTYSIEPFIRSEGPGTTVILYLKPHDNKDDELPDFTDEWVLRSTVKKHSDFIAHPIKMEISREQPVEGDEDKTETVIEDQLLNSQKAIWLKKPSEVSDEEYTEFYTHLSHDYQEPLTRLHYRAEGVLDFTALLFVPTRRPWNYDYEGIERGLSLYVKRVLIMNDCEELIPPYLRFMKGVIDSSDLSLNVSREMLQHNRQILAIKKAITGRIIKTLQDLLAEDRQKYQTFWKEFGQTLKEGIIREPERADKLQPVFLFHSSTQAELTTLEEYSERMKEGQPAIYYMVADSLEHARKSPYLERLKDKGYEVLIMVDPVDEFVAGKFKDFKEKSFQSITAKELQLDTSEEKQEKEQKKEVQKKELASVITVLEETLKDDIKEVLLSDRLTETPACLVTEGDAPSNYLEQMYRQMGQEPPKQKRILEINASHPVYGKMQKLAKDKQQEWAKLLFDQAVINEGGRIEDPVAFTRKFTELLIESN